jgi:hypothetical protein
MAESRYASSCDRAACSSCWFGDSEAASRRVQAPMAGASTVDLAGARECGVSVLVNGEDARAYGRLFEEIEPIGHTELMQSGDQLRFAYVRVDGMPTIRNVTISGLAWAALRSM